MHNYYRAIGFKKIKNTKEILRRMVEKSVIEYKERKLDMSPDKLVEIFVPFGRDIGMIIHGEFLENGEFELEYTYPFVRAKRYEYYDNIVVERNSFNYSFSAACDNKSNGLTIVFYLQNGLDYVNCRMPSKVSAEIGFSAISLFGKVILPSKQNENYVHQNEIVKENRSKLIEDAKNGNEEAIENLTFEEMDTYSRISKRILNEDVLSIVESSFMPTGLECDIYSVIGKIIDWEESYNSVTRVKLYNLTLECNDIILNVIIDGEDLLGEPSIGRRFKGNIWLQGNINFHDA